MGSPHAGFIEVLIDEIESNPAFADIDIIRHQWPRRDHDVPERICRIIEGTESFTGRIGSQAEDEWRWPIIVEFSLRLLDDDEGNIGEIMGGWTHELMEIARTRGANIFAAATLPSGASYLRCLVTEPVIITGGPPRTHRKRITITPQTCQLRRTA